MTTRSIMRPASLALLAALASAPAAAAVFVNELHYDNSNGDVGEGIEVVATAGEDLSTYQVVLYNGANANAGTTYSTRSLPAGSPASCGSTVSIASLRSTNLIQNGGNDGIALVDGNGQVVQFLSYEGSLKGSNGPAAGMTSTTIPVAETNSTPAGTSLQLSGSGKAASDFSWRSSAAQTFGQCNLNQTFAGAGTGTGTRPSVSSTLPANGASNVAVAADLQVQFSEAVTAASGAFALQCTQAGAVSLAYPGSGTSFSLSPQNLLSAGDSCQLTVTASRITDADGLTPASNTVVSFTVANNSTAGYWSKVNTSSPSQLRCSLHATIRGHTSYPYSGSGTNTWTILEIADEDPNNPNNILDIYRNRSYPKVSARAGTGSGLTYNREHTWPKSLGFPSATGDKGLPYAPHTDAHMLYLSDTNFNSSRGNKPLAGCSSGCTALATEANAGDGGGSARGQKNWFVGPDGNGGSFETWDGRKGDIARAVLYMAIRYEGDAHPVTGQGEPDLELTNDRSKIVLTSSSPAYMGLLSTLLQWHQADPPTARERERNEVVYSFQGNRNPFIDHPEWASEALFTSAKPASCQLN
ncbi:endonuclease [Stenotrophomonas sp.]|uniref:endonuclease n=1 Tax=Stenotrophomonas sp. TaxID=69392 RepID=UPI0028B0BEBE|nr:endonuclease [Stenotrophomonas sp.]